MRHLTHLRIALFACLTVAAVSASAEVVTYELTDVRFEDGGSAIGSFTWDTVSSSLQSWDITTTPGTLRPSTVSYMSGTPGNNQLPAGNAAIFLCSNSCITAQLYLAGLLPFGSSAVVQLHPDSQEWDNALASSGRNVISGSLTMAAVPEASSTAMLIAGLTCLAWLRTQRSARAKGDA